MTILLELRRDPTQTTDCTVGTLICLSHETLRLQTIERPWIPCAPGVGGKPFESCIAPGLYRVLPYLRPSGERAFRLSNPTLDVYEMPQDIPSARRGTARSLILMHAGNYAHDTAGGIAIGRSRQRNGAGIMVTDTRDAMNVLRTVIGSTFDISLRIYT